MNNEQRKTKYYDMLLLLEKNLKFTNRVYVVKYFIKVIAQHSCLFIK